MITPFSTLFGFCLGAIIGSFLAALVDRWPRGASVISGRSACTSCGHTLAPYEMVPLLSFLIQRGKCRQCKAAIGAQLFVIEALAALAGFWAFSGGLSEAALALCLFAWMLIALAALDWLHFWLPNILLLFLALAGLAVGPWLNDVALLDRIIGGAAGFLSLWAVALGYKLVRGREGIGGGDPKLFGAIGLWLGWQALPMVLLISTFLALLAVMVALTRGWKGDRQTPVPLGTALACGSLLFMAFPA